MSDLSYGNTGYASIYPQDQSGFAMGMPTVDTGAAISNLNVSTQAGINPMPAVTGAPAATVPPSGAGVAPSGPGFFSEFGPAQFGLGAIQTLGSLWNSFQQNKLANKTFQFQKQAYATNLANVEKNYNTALEDRINARYVTEGRSNVEADKAAYMDKNHL